MDITTLTRQFEAIGATLTVRRANEPDPRINAFVRSRSARAAATAGFALDVVPPARPSLGSRGESYLLTLSPDGRRSVELLAVDVSPHTRHLLLLARPLTAGHGTAADGNEITERRKLLCGHDERHWFVAAIPPDRSGGVASVTDAFAALKPFAAHQSQRRHGVRARDWNRRDNAGFIRQGEWFFLPRPTFAPQSSLLILRNEPIRRGSDSKPHWVEELYRVGGETVYVGTRHRFGITFAQYERLLATTPEARDWNWQVMKRNAHVYARGKIRHPDHATITLPFWHEVVMNQEGASKSVVFLD